MNPPNPVMRGLATLAAIGFVLLIPLALFAANLGTVLFSAETLLRIVDDHVLTEETPALLVETAVQSTLGNNAATSAVTSAISSNPAILNSLFPRALWLELSRQLLNNTFAWLDSPDDTLTFTIDLVPFKGYLTENAAGIAGGVVNSLPPCNLLETATWAGLLLGGVFGGDVTFEDLPQCIPAGQFEGVASAAASLFSGQVSNLPDTLTLENVGSPERLTQLKSNLAMLEMIMTWIWPVALLLLLLAFFLGGRSWAKRMPWAGWPLLIAALLTLGVMFFLPGVVQFLAAPYLAMVPALLKIPAYALLNGISAEVQPLFLPQIVIMASLGMACLLGGWLLGQREQS